MKKKVFVQSGPKAQKFPKYKKVIKPNTPTIKKSCCGKVEYDND